MWVLEAFLSAFFAGVTAILAKTGIKNVDSHLATALRTIIVTLFAWLMVWITGGFADLPNVTGTTLLFLVLSGLTTGASWLCYYYAIQHGKVSVVVPIDKMSIVLTVLFAYIVFKEKLSKKAFVGLCLMVAATVVMAIFG